MHSGADAASGIEPGAAASRPAPAPERGGGLEPGKRAPLLFCVALLAATLAPVAQNWAERPEDGFPFSYYPMFSRRVAKTYKVTHAVGIEPGGREHIVPYRYMGSGGFNEVRLYAERAARREPERFCARVAAAVRARPSGALRDVGEIAIRTGGYALDAFYAGKLDERTRREHARCRIPR